MNEIFNLTVGWGSQVSLGIRIITFFLLLFSVLPLQIKEALVKNGLHKLRTQMLIGGVTIFLSNLATIGRLIIMFMFHKTSTPISEFLQLLNAVAFLILAGTYYFIYHQQFSLKQKELHHKIEVIEKGEERRKVKKRKEEKKHGNT